MAIEIRELHIRLAVTAAGASAPAGAPSQRSGADAASREALVETCVEQVMDLLRERGER